ncbi:MAG: fimbrial protein [Mucinivorans sp.]
MMKRITHILFLALLFGVVSCSKTMVTVPEPGPNDVQIKLSVLGAQQVQSRADVDGLPEENKIHSLQIFFFKTSSGQPKEQVITINTGDDSGITADQMWDAQSQSLILRNFKNPETERIVYVVANTTINAASITNEKDLKDYIITTATQPLAAPTAVAGVVMSGKSAAFKFSDNPNIALSLTRQAVKVRLTVKLALESSYPNFEFRTTQPKVRALNLPIKSYIIGRDVAPGGDLVDLDYRTMSHVGDEWTTEMYVYENPAIGTLTKQNTKFILSVPYALPGGKVVDNNYYLINLNNNTADPYKTVRNNFYDVKVTVGRLGGDIPTIEGTEVTTEVLPWDGLEFNIHTDNINILEISNKDCDIYGDNADNILVGTAVVNREGVEGIAYITTSGSGFTLASPSTVTLKYGEPVELRIKTTGNFTGGTVTVRMVQETESITISKQREKSRIDISTNSVQSDVPWCTLSQKETYAFAEQKRSISIPLGAVYAYIINKGSIVGSSQPRIANLMSTTYATAVDQSDAVRRIVVVQQPYITNGTTDKVAWASGHISLGHRPDGRECYVIGDTHSHGLLFFAGRSWGIDFKSKGDWSSNENYYIPSGIATSASVLSNKNINYSDLLNAAAAGDPCTYVYTSDKSVKWRTPTSAELEVLATTKVDAPGRWTGGVNGESANDRENIAFNTLRGDLYLPLTGHRGTDGTVDNANGALTTNVELWSTTSIPSTDNYKTFIAYTSFWVPNGEAKMADENKNIAKAIRCVRDIIK